MRRFLIHFSVVLYWLTDKDVKCQSVGGRVQQSPPSLVEISRETAELFCSQNFSSYDTILWYQQSGGAGAMKLIGYIFYDTKTENENNFQKCKISGDGRNKLTLVIPELTANDSGVYFCAASKHCCSSPLSATNPSLIQSKHQCLIHLDETTETDYYLDKLLWLFFLFSVFSVLDNIHLF